MEFVRNTLCTLGLYRRARLIRNRYVRPELRLRGLRWRQFYSQFISPGDLVFDIGANRGDRTELFVEMGASVVAVEPVPSLAASLENIFRYSPVKVEAVGVGSRRGKLPLHICTTSECSSFSDEFIQSERGRHTNFNWDRAEVISIVTADDLIEKHGTPAFIKIDVEGFEAEVLAGLNQPVRGLSFEVRPADPPERITGCLERLSDLAQYEFNLSLEEDLTFEVPRWDTGRSVLAALSGGDSSGWRYGDIYARRL